jgi:hypothetical protein
VNVEQGCEAAPSPWFAGDQRITCTSPDSASFRLACNCRDVSVWRIHLQVSISLSSPHNWNLRACTPHSYAHCRPTPAQFCSRAWPLTRLKNDDVHEHAVHCRYPRPGMTVDACIVAKQQPAKVLLIQRKKPPCKVQSPLHWETQKSQSFLDNMTKHV